MSCCTEILSLGCFDSCEDIETGLTAPQAGTYIIKSDNAEIVSFTLGLGDEIIIPGGYFNENGTTEFQIILPDGNVFTSGDYDCFSVTINPSNSYSGEVINLEYGSDSFVS